MKRRKNLFQITTYQEAEGHLTAKRRDKLKEAANTKQGMYVHNIQNRIKK